VLFHEGSESLYSFFTVTVDNGKTVSKTGMSEFRIPVGVCECMSKSIACCHVPWLRAVSLQYGSRPRRVNFSTLCRQAWLLSALCFRVLWVQECMGLYLQFSSTSSGSHPELTRNFTTILPSSGLLRGVRVELSVP
jgi:hypothetical protein